MALSDSISRLLGGLALDCASALSSTGIVRTLDLSTPFDLSFLKLCRAQIQPMFNVSQLRNIIAYHTLVTGIDATAALSINCALSNTFCCLQRIDRERQIKRSEKENGTWNCIRICVESIERTHRLKCRNPHSVTLNAKTRR